jgi:hypothetical protein
VGEGAVIIHGSMPARSQLYVERSLLRARCAISKPAFLSVGQGAKYSDNAPSNLMLCRLEAMYNLPLFGAVHSYIYILMKRMSH